MGKGSVHVSLFRATHNGMLTNIRIHVEPGTLKVCIFHGSGRPKSSEGVIDHDLVLTTYATLSADSIGLRILQKIEWYRVVLDEGRSIHHCWRKSLPLYYTDHFEQLTGSEIRIRTNFALPKSSVPRESGALLALRFKIG